MILQPNQDKIYLDNNLDNDNNNYDDDDDDSDDNDDDDNDNDYHNIDVTSVSGNDGKFR